MFFISFVELDRAIRRFRDSRVSVNEGLRGWNWSSEYLSPVVDDVLLGVSEIANRYCPTYRDIYLKRVACVKAPYTFKTVRGWVYHAISSETLTQVKTYLYNSGVVPGYRVFMDLVSLSKKVIGNVFRGLDVKRYLSDDEYKRLLSDAKALYRYLILQAASNVDRVASEVKYLTVDTLVNKAIPSVVERSIDGSLLGLSSELRVDMLLENDVILDIKTGDIRPFHKYTLAGYALAIECDLEKPIDYGVITYLSIENEVVKVNNQVYFISDELRREFLKFRDEAMEVIYSGKDPGKPIKCPEYCIYYSVCNPLG